MMADTDEILIEKISRATAALIVEEMAVQKAQAELVSKSKEVGLLLLEAKKRHPKVADFEAFLKRVNGLKLSRAYDLLRLAGGRTTDEELRKDARERVRKHRAKKKLPTPEPVSVTGDDVTEKPKPAAHRITESAEISAEQRRAENERLDKADGQQSAQTNKPARDNRGREKFLRCVAILATACRTTIDLKIPRLPEDQLIDVIEDLSEGRAILTALIDNLKEDLPDAKARAA